MVYECRAVYAPGIGMAQDKVDVPLFELGDEIILARRFSHSLRYSLLGRTDVDAVFRPLHPSVYRRAAGELAEAGSLERRCYCIAVVVSSEIDKTVIFPSVDPAVGLLTPDIIQSEYGVILADGLELIALWERKVLTCDEAAAYSGIGIRRLRKMALAKGCPFAIANGTQILIAREKFDAYMDKAEKV